MGNVDVSNKMERFPKAQESYAEILVLKDTLELDMLGCGMQHVTQSTMTKFSQQWEGMILIIR